MFMTQNWTIKSNWSYAAVMATKIHRGTARLTARGSLTRARIIAGATDLVYDQGVAGTSLDDIMAATGTSKSQLYHYFADKDALILEVIRNQLAKIIAGQGTELRAARSWDGLQRWRDHVVESTSATGGVGGCPLGSLSSELADRSESARRVLAACFAEWEEYLLDGFRAMRAGGELSQDADPQSLATAVMAALQGGLLLSQATHDVQPLELALDMALGHVRHYRPED